MFTYTEQERREYRAVYEQKLHEKYPNCSCSVTVWIVNNGTDFARLDAERVEDRMCPVHSD